MSPYPFQFTSPLAGTLSIQCQLPREAAEKFASELRALVQLPEGRWYYELTGIQGQELRKDGPFRLLFGKDTQACLADPDAYLHDLQTFWHTLPSPILPEHVSALLATAQTLFERHCPVVDKTETLAQVEAKENARHAAEVAQQAERAQIVAAYADHAEEIQLAKGEMGIVLALVYDNSDIMTDYYHPRAVKHSFLLARLRPQKRQERVLRQTLARYPDLHTAWTWHGSDKYSHGPDCYLKSDATFAYRGTPFKAYAGSQITQVWYEIRFVTSGRYLPYKGFGNSDVPGPQPETPALAASAKDIRLEYERDWTWLFFPTKPDETVRERLRGMGGRWGRQRGGWYFRRHIPQAEFAWLFEPSTPSVEPLSEPSPTPIALRETPGPAGFLPGKGSAYEYIPPWMEVPGPYATEKQPDPLAVIKLFTPDSNWTWYLLEYDGRDLAFGLVVGFETELGDFSLREISAARGPLGVQPERDIWFRPTPITQLPEYRAKWGDDGPYRGGSTPTPTPIAPTPPQLPPTVAATLPNGWTENDLAFLLTQLDLGPILIADDALGFPTIHDFPNADHLGYGLFRVQGADYTLYFDGGKSMQRTPSGKGWTQLDIQGDYPYKLDAARTALTRYLVAKSPTPDILILASAEEVQAETTASDAHPAQELLPSNLPSLGSAETRLPNEAPAIEENPAPTPEDHAEFEAWQLELLTGQVQKKDSIFYRALTAVHRPGTLHLALQHVNGDHLRRKRLEERLSTLQAV